MNNSTWIRRLHRLMSIAFTLTVIANFVAMAQGSGTPPSWITYAPLLPLALLLLTGLYLFTLPYFSLHRTRHSPQRSAGDREAPLA
jgi:hypothetical protein